jgi:tetratricopeptide (TPR) repeat protein
MLKVLKLLAPTLIGFFYLFLFLLVLNPSLGLISLPILVAIEAYIISKDWGAFLVILEKYDEAIQHFTQKINSGQANTNLYNGRGAAYFIRGDSYAATQDFKKAIQLDPKNISAHDNLGCAYTKNGEFEMALASHENALAINPKNANSYANRGIVFKKLYKDEEALADFNQAIRLAPNDATSYYHCGSMFFERQEYASALRCYKSAFKLNSKFQPSEAGLAITLDSMGKTQDARAVWKSVVMKNSHYQNIEWLENELEWTYPLVMAASKLIAAMTRRT